jgi:hypothetical protein
VRVEAGLTTSEPFRLTFVTVPLVRSVIVADVPFTVDHESVELWPALIVVGEAEYELMDAGGSTATVTMLWTLPAPFVTVNV